MSAAEESPAQQAARLRRERREAKIKAGGTARLERITGLSGRPTAGISEESSPTPSAFRPSPTPPPQSPPQDRQARSVSPFVPPRNEENSPENIRAQEEYIRAFLRSQQAGNGQQPEQDPTTKLLNTLLSTSQPGVLGPGAGGAAAVDGSIPELTPDDLTSALGIPRPLASIFARQVRPDSPEEQARNTVWKFAHAVFALLIAAYVLFLFQSAVSTFGADPPPPSSMLNPFVIFATGEAVLAAGRVGRKVREGQARSLGTWGKVVGDVVRDGKIVVFVLGMWSVFGGLT